MERPRLQPDARVEREVQQNIAEVKTKVLVQSDSAVALLEKAFALGARAELPDTLWSDLYFLKGIIFYYKGAPDTAIAYYQKALEKAATARAGFYLAKNHLEIGKALLSYSSYDQAIVHLNQAAHLFDSLQMPEKCAYAWTLLGGAYNEIGRYDKAAEELVAALETLERKGGDQRVLAALCINLSNSFTGIGSEAESVYYLKKALEIAQKSDDRLNVASAMVNLGLKYRATQPDSALLFYKNALQIQAQSAPAESRLSTLFNIGNLYLDENNSQVADRYFDSVLVLSRTIAMPKGVAMALSGKGQVAAKVGRPVIARAFFQEAIHLADSLQNLEMQVQFLEKLCETESQLGDYPAALRSLRMHAQLRDSLAQTEKAKAVYAIEQKYQNKQKDLEIVRLNAESKLQKRIIIANWLIIFAATLLAILLGVFAFVHSRLSRQRWEAYRELLQRYEATQARRAPQQPQKSTEASQAEALVKNLYALFNLEHPYLDPELRVDQLADKLGVSYRMLNAAVKDVEGVNLTAFINRYRVNAVVEMFKNPDFHDLKIPYIAQKAGFGSVSTFYVAFQEVTGLQPGNYRKILEEKMRDMLNQADEPPDIGAGTH